MRIFALLLVLLVPLIAFAGSVGVVPGGGLWTAISGFLGPGNDGDGLVLKSAAGTEQGTIAVTSPDTDDARMAFDVEIAGSPVTMLALEGNFATGWITTDGVGVKPTTTNTSSLGTSGVRWKNGYFSGLVDVATAGSLTIASKAVPSHSFNANGGLSAWGVSDQSGAGIYDTGTEACALVGALGCIAVLDLATPGTPAVDTCSHVVANGGYFIAFCQ